MALRVASPSKVPIVATSHLMSTRLRISALPWRNLILLLRQTQCHRNQVTVHVCFNFFRMFIDPTWVCGTPFLPFFLPCPFTSSSFALFYFFPFPFLVHFTYSLLSSIPSHSTRIVTTSFPGRRS